MFDFHLFLIFLDRLRWLCTVLYCTYVQRRGMKSEGTLLCFWETRWTEKPTNKRQKQKGIVVQEEDKTQTTEGIPNAASKQPEMEPTPSECIPSITPRNHACIIWYRRLPCTPSIRQSIHQANSLYRFLLRMIMPCTQRQLRQLLSQAITTLTKRVYLPISNNK